MLRPSRIKTMIHSLMALDHPFNRIQTDPLVIPCPRLPAAFRLARIAVVADVHLPDNLISIERIAHCVALQKPDAIFLPGDLTNSYTDFDAAGLRRLAQALTPIAPCFAIPGNHELRLEREPLYGEILTACGVHYMCDSYADWHKDGQTLRLFGMGRRRPAPLQVENQPTIVLAHKPERLPYYEAARWDAVICGHAHGGQVRMGNFALYAPGQGFFPKYIGGIYTAGNTVMAVSRGLGNSSLPWRVGNHPHLPMVLLVDKK